MNSASNKKALIVGLGKTGLSCARYLQAQGWSFDFADSREAPTMAEQVAQLFPNADRLLGAFSEAMLDGVDMLVLSPGVDPRDPVIQQAYAQGMDVVGDIELFARAVSAPVIAITGSNGKSTVTELVGAMAKAAGLNVAVGGNLGTPALELLSDTTELYVMELSSFQLETMQSLKPAAAVVLNISEDHMDRYDSYADYIAAKSVIYKQAAVSLVNLDDAVVAAMNVDGQRVGFSVKMDADYSLAVDQLKVTGDVVLPVADLKVQGSHNYANALAALALADAVNISREASLKALLDFSGLAHRTQWIAEHGGVTYINDSKATNVGATAAAIEGIAQTQVLIAGGVGKDQDFAPLAEVLRNKVRHTVLMGRDADRLEMAIADSCANSYAKDMQDAVAQASAKAEQGDVVLLSPACASFDMYSGFEARGNDFVNCVNKLQQQEVRP